MEKKIAIWIDFFEYRPRLQQRCIALWLFFRWYFECILNCCVTIQIDTNDYEPIKFRSIKQFYTLILCHFIECSFAICTREPPFDSVDECSLMRADSNVAWSVDFFVLLKSSEMFVWIDFWNLRKYQYFNQIFELTQFCWSTFMKFDRNILLNVLLELYPLK